ncbi:MAG TPA: WYL domain-containing protein [Aeromicrobium sp.]|nr:WYL domain-containing protein [Aeromicrobium sp.]
MTAADRLTRLFALVPYLQNNQGIPVQQVAEEFGVTVKEILKDISTLCVTGTADEHGQLIDFDYSALEDEGLIYIRDAEFLPRPLRLSRNEGIALVIALRALRETAGGQERVVIDSALAKIEAAVGDAALAPVDIHVEQVDAAILATVRESLDQAQRLEIDYTTQSRDERAHRQVDPLRLFTSEGHHYLEAWCLREQDVRIFRLDRMLSATLTGEPAETRTAEPRDLAADLFASPDAPFGVFDLEPRAHWMVEYYRATVLSSHDDVLRAKIVGADWAWLVRFGLRCAGMARVVEPAALAKDVAAAARAALSAYDGSTSTTEG